jgi:Ras-related protein Rab-2A
MSEFIYTFKYIVVGDSGVGKSCLTTQFLDNQFSEKHNATIGVEFGTKKI